MRIYTASNGWYLWVWYYISHQTPHDIVSRWGFSSCFKLYQCLCSGPFRYQWLTYVLILVSLWGILEILQFCLKYKIGAPPHMILSQVNYCLLHNSIWYIPLSLFVGLLCRFFLLKGKFYGALFPWSLYCNAVFISIKWTQYITIILTVLSFSLVLVTMPR